MKQTFRKAMSVFLVVAMLLCAAPLNGFVGLDLPQLFDFKAQAATYSGTCGTNLTWALDTDTGVLEITGTGAMKYWTSYSSVPWYSYRSYIQTVSIAGSVTSIGDYAFYGCTSLKSMTIPDSVTSIGSYAFEGCTSLTSITIPGSVTSIGSYAFEGCTSLASITIPDSVTSIGYRTFYGCTSLASVTIGNSVTTIGEYAFYGCTSLASITIPDSVTSIGNYAFDGCTSLTSVTIGNSVTSIGSSAFYNCTSLTSITIPDSVTSIGSSAFYGCSKLALMLKKDSYAETYAKNYSFLYYYSFDGSEDKTISLTVNSKLSFEIDKETYTMTINCSGNMFSFADEDAPWVAYEPYIKHIIISDGCTSVSENAFKNMWGITSVTIPDSVTSIGNDVFYKCTSLASVTIPDSVTSIGDYAFFGCTSLTSVTIGNSVTSIGSSAFYNCTSLTSITIPDSVTSIGSSAFSGCTSLTSVTIPDSATSIDDYAFRGCTSLISFTVDEGNTKYSSDEYGVLFNKNKTQLIQYPAGNEHTSYTIPDSVTSIGSSAFYGCTSLTSIAIPISAKIYNSSYTFYNCTNIEKITFTKGNGTVQDYGTSTSSYSSTTYYKYTPWHLSRAKCTEIIIEDGVAGIGDYMFYDCAEVGDITLPFSVQSIGNYAFAGCQKLGKLKVYNRNCEFEANATAYYTTIVGYAGSTAEAYANENGFSFEPIADNDHEHTYTNSCDSDCNICGYIAAGRGHSFDNGCDPECGVCGYTRTELVHTYTYGCDPECDLCGYTRTELEHQDENADGKCDMCETYISDIQVGVTQNVKVDAGKTVLLKFIPTQSGVYTFTSSSSSDTYGYIYDADKKQLASNDGSGEGSNFLITYTLKRDTVYYLGVRFYSSSASGEIPVTLSLDQVICDHLNTHTEHKDPTCTETGYDKVICDDCGDTVSTTTIAKVPHKYKTIVAEPTCVDEGVVVCLCSVCRDAYIDEILDPLGHSEPVWKTVVKPTTSSEGTMNYVCPACDEVFDTKSISAIALSGNSTAVVNFATNTITGFDAGSTNLEDYLSATNNGYVFTCTTDVIGTGAVVELTDGDTLINSYTVVVFGDIDGDGWYDANDAFIVNMIVSGLISEDVLNEAERAAADCNHDGVIDALDFELLINASVLLDDVDQSATQEELAANAFYIDYCSLIDQTAGAEINLAPDFDDAPETNETVELADKVDAQVFIVNIFAFIKKIIAMIFTFIV